MECQILDRKLIRNVKWYNINIFLYKDQRKGRRKNIKKGIIIPRMKCPSLSQIVFYIYYTCYAYFQSISHSDIRETHPGLSHQCSNTQQQRISSKNDTTSIGRVGIQLSWRSLIACMSNHFFSSRGFFYCTKCILLVVYYCIVRMYKKLYMYFMAKLDPWRN